LGQERLPGVGLSEQKAQGAEKVGFPGAEMTLEKDSPALAVTEGGEDCLQVVEDFLGDDEGLQNQLAQVRIYEILQLDNGPDLGNFNEILNEEGFLIS
jgi:hypothetical protein